MKQLLVLLFYLLSPNVTFAEMQLSTHQLEILQEYKESTRLCARSRVCRKITVTRENLHETDLQQMMVNLKLMKEDLNQSNKVQTSSP